MYFVLYDVGAAAIMFLVGILFYKSNGRAASFLSGYNLKTKKERKKYDEIQMCKDYGKRMIYMAIPFLLGAAIDIRFAGVGCLGAWGVWMMMFVSLMIERHKRER